MVVWTILKLLFSHDAKLWWLCHQYGSYRKLLFRHDARLWQLCQQYWSCYPGLMPNFAVCVDYSWPCQQYGSGRKLLFRYDANFWWLCQQYGSCPSGMMPNFDDHSNNMEVVGSCYSGMMPHFDGSVDYSWPCQQYGSCRRLLFRHDARLWWLCRRRRSKASGWRRWRSSRDQCASSTPEDKRQKQTNLKLLVSHRKEKPRETNGLSCQKLSIIFFLALKVFYRRDVNGTKSGLPLDNLISDLPILTWRQFRLRSKLQTRKVPSKEALTIRFPERSKFVKKQGRTHDDTIRVLMGRSANKDWRTSIHDDTIRILLGGAKKTTKVTNFLALIIEPSIHTEPRALRNRNSLPARVIPGRK